MPNGHVIYCNVISVVEFTEFCKSNWYVVYLYMGGFQLEFVSTVDSGNSKLDFVTNFVY